MANNPQENATGRNRASGKWVALGIVVILVIISIVVLSSFMGGGEQGAEAKGVANITAPEEPKTVGGKGSVEYNAQLIEQDKKEAIAAKESGESRIPIIVGNSSGTNRLDLLNVSEVKAKEIVIPKPLKRDPPRSRRNNRGNNGQPPAEIITPTYSTQMGDIMALMTYQSAATTVYMPTEMNAEMLSNSNSGANGENTNGANANNGMDADLKPPLNLTARSILYAVNDIRLNSDIKSTHVRATVLAGEYRDAIVNGKFTRYEGKLTLEYYQLVTKEGVAYSIKGFAIDPQTTEASVASDVDWHYISRWGGLASASFLEGLGDAVRMSSQQMSTGVGGQVVQMNPEYSLGEKAAIAAGNMGSKLAGMMEKNFDRPPTVTLEPGIAMGIIILSAEG